MGNRSLHDPRGLYLMLAALWYRSSPRRCFAVAARCLCWQKTRASCRIEPIDPDRRSFNLCKPFSTVGAARDGVVEFDVAPVVLPCRREPPGFILHPRIGSCM